jgi:hypothetical protein
MKCRWSIVIMLLLIYCVRGMEMLPLKAYTGCGVARGVFQCPRLATNDSADSRLRLQLCRLASAQLTVVKVKVTLRSTTSLSVSLGFEPVWGSWPNVNYCLTVTVLSISGAPSDERSGLPFVLVTWTASVQFSKFAAGPRQHSISPYL